MDAQGAGQAPSDLEAGLPARVLQLPHVVVGDPSPNGDILAPELLGLSMLPESIHDDVNIRQSGTAVKVFLTWIYVTTSGGSGAMIVDVTPGQLLKVWRNAVIMHLTQVHSHRYC
jgi:hypothetical protein